jgi:hypothetical protein
VADRNDAFCENLDGTVCNGISLCAPGTAGADSNGCVASSSPLNCQSQDGCSTGTCDAVQGCIFTADNSRCVGNFCDGPGQCLVGTGCSFGPAPSCDDGLSCTRDSCDRTANGGQGACVHAPDDDACADSFACNGSETCDPDTDPATDPTGCSRTAPPPCPNIGQCIVGTCLEPNGACQQVRMNSLCGAGQVCNAAGQCVAGQACTSDAQCQDGIFCNGAEVCVGPAGAGVCQGAGTPAAGSNQPPTCDDGDPCTVDSCDEANRRCVHTPRDRDGDGFGDCACSPAGVACDCDDTDPTINPNGVDAQPNGTGGFVCDGKDNDCKNGIDNGKKQDGGSCNAATDCCSGRCANNVCTTPIGVCHNVGQVCSFSADCCTGLCAPNQAGQFTCQPGGTCRGGGGSCRLAGDCCSLNCNIAAGQTSGSCVDGQGSCRINGQSCDNNGDCCSAVCTNGTCADGPSNCTEIGNPCSGNNGCCSGNCANFAGIGQRCDRSNRCRSEGEACSAAQDCCNGICDRNPASATGYCRDRSGHTSAGEPCTSSSVSNSCASNACAPSGFGGTALCQFLSGCRPIDELCHSNADCCSRNCTFLQSITPGDPAVGTCGTTLVGNCLDPGEVCQSSSNGRCRRQDGTCPGSDPDGLCRTSVAGVSRCFSRSIGGACRQANETCAFSDECCNGAPCIPSGNGFVCAGSDCVPTDGVCTQDADCCGGACLPGTDLVLRCSGSQGGSGCIPLGGNPCATDTDCCSGSCRNGFCRIPTGG